MTKLPFIGAVVCGCLGVMPLAHAASGQINSFSASATSVLEGTLVDFTVDFGLSTDGWSTGGSDLNEPAPVEGNQLWHLNWYSTTAESVASVWLSAGGNSFNDYPSVPANSGYNGSWTFSILFDTQGTFDITLNGGWSNLVETSHSNESATRDCYNEDPGGSNNLICSAWNYIYDDGSDSYTVDNSFGSQTITIQVAAVPEPGTWGLALSGLVVAGAAARRTRRQALLKKSL